MKLLLVFSIYLAHEFTMLNYSAHLLRSLAINNPNASNGYNYSLASLYITCMFFIGKKCTVEPLNADMLNISKPCDFSTETGEEVS